MRSYDYKNNLPIDYIIDRSQVGDQTFLEVLEIHLKAGFDILERPSNAQKAKKAMSFWETMIAHNRITKEAISMIKE